MGYIVIVIATILGWKANLRSAWIAAIISGIAVYKMDVSPNYVLLVGGLLLVYPVSVIAVRFARRTLWGVRRHFTDRRIRMPSDIRRGAWSKWGRTCIYCGNPAEHLDHIKPYWWLEKHGYPLHDIDNLRPACARCNMLVSGRVFDNLSEKKKWVRAHVRQKGGGTYIESPWANTFKFLRR